MCGILQCNVSSYRIRDPAGLYEAHYQTLSTGNCTTAFYPTRTLGTVPNGTSCGTNMVMYA